MNTKLVAMPLASAMCVFQQENCTGNGQVPTFCENHKQELKSKFKDLGIRQDNTSCSIIYDIHDYSVTLGDSSNENTDTTWKRLHIKFQEMNGNKVKFKGNISKIFEPIASSLIGVDFSGADTSEMIDMSCMFKGCENLETLDLSNFNTQNATNMSSMFEVCNKLEQ